MLYIKIRRILHNKYGEKIDDSYVSTNKVGLNSNVGGFINNYSNSYIDFPNHNYKIFYKIELYNSLSDNIQLNSNILNNGYIILYEFKNELNEDGYVKQIVFKRDISLNNDISNNYNTFINAKDYDLTIIPKFNNSKLLLKYNLNYLSSYHSDQYIEFAIIKNIYRTSNINETIIDSSYILSNDILKISNGYGGYYNLYNYNYLDNDISSNNKISYQLLYKLISPLGDNYNNYYTNNYGIIGYDQSLSNTISVTEINENNGIIMNDTNTNNNIINSIYRFDDKYFFKQILYKNLSNNLNIDDYNIIINPQLFNSTIYIKFNINFLLSYYSDNLVSFSIYKNIIDLFDNNITLSNELIKNYGLIGSKNANAYFTNKLNFELYDNNINNYNLVKYYITFNFQNNDLSNISLSNNNSNFILAYEV